jgi:hypothetical protein
MIILDANPGPYNVGADGLSDPGAAGQSMHTTAAPATIAIKKRGPRIDYDTAIKVAQIVEEIAPDGKWRANLDDVLVALDGAVIPTPKTWRPKHGYRSWYAAAADTVTRGRHMAIEAIKHRLKRAKEMPTETIP